ncbi:MAG: glycosyltransferase family 4 protein [Bacillota bacterium]|nr:glycosyltransferase family 4 protein [Bacillota bacterium]
MKILHLTNGYFHTTLYRELLKHLKESDSEIEPETVVLSGKDEKNEPEAGVHDIKLFNKYDRYFYFHKQRKSFRAVKKVTNLGDINLVHAHFLFTNGGVALRIKKQYKVPYIVAVRNTDVNVFFKKLKHLRAYGVKIMEQAEKIIFLSEAYQDAVLETYVPLQKREDIRSKCEVIPNGIDQFWLDNKNIHTRDDDSKKINIVFAGRIDENKNCMAAVFACEKLIEKGYDVHYTAVGNVSSKEIFDSIKAKPFTECLPPKSKEELIELYKNQDIFLMPSKHETFGLSYAEAMTQGLPVIYTRGQGFDKQFPEGTVGYSVDCLDSDEIAEKILKILSGFNEMSSRCAENSGKFDWDIISKKYIKIYDVNKRI